MQLKVYQEHTLASLQQFFRRATAATPKLAFIELTENPYRSIPQLPGLPYICLRLPTGGGKTLLAAHACGLAIREYLRADRGVVLWLVPSTAILEQTLVALRNLSHPYRLALQQSLGGGPVGIFNLQEALYIQRSVLDGETCVIVSTLAALRVNDTEGRKIYESAGALQHHFSGLTPELDARLDRDENGVVSYSLANVLRLRRPVVIMDEAHNARTPLSFDVLARLAPSCIVEFTATPARVHKPDAGQYASNVLHHVSAAELKAEQMIRLPVRLLIRDDWKDVLADSLAQRDALEKLAQDERAATGEYIRPILLVQAQPRRAPEALSVEVVKQALLDDCKVPASHVAVATSEKNEIEGVNLLGEDCPIRIILTVQALKEGWDCPFAYVLCSVAELSSSTAVEQILGRILRMPGAREKQQPPLNRAYAYVASRNFYDAAKGLTDALVQSGFERFEAAAMIDGGGGSTLFSDGAPSFFDHHTARVTTEPDTSTLPTSIRTRVSFDADRQTLCVEGTLTDADREALKALFTKPEDHAAVDALFQASQPRAPSGPLFPAQRGEPFVVPQLALRVDGQLELFEESSVLDTPWKLSEFPAALTEAEFASDPSTSHAYDIDVTDEGKLEARYVSDVHAQLQQLFPTHPWTVAELANWLDRSIPHPDITRTESSLFLHRLVTDLVDGRKLSIERLAKDQFRLRDAAERKIADLRLAARKRAYQAVLDLDASSGLEVSEDFSFHYDPARYPANWYYDGAYKFRKHYYPQVGELKAEGEEFACAQAMDQLKGVRFWVRNLERQPISSFWLQTSTDKFYPDFVAQLENGRLLVIEYKGAHLVDSPDSKEKRAIGELWAERSAGRALFLMLTEKTLSGLAAVVKQ
ncbi:MAG: DEAD/DEAH box helicase [Acidobacteriota bacterium]